MKKKVRGVAARLDVQEEREIRSIPFQAGCTACVCLMTSDTIFCANAGDSRAIISNKSGKCTELSYDHKPDNDGEMKRVKAAGGFVEDGRVQGVIAVSRAIGDWEYKQPSLLPQLEKKKSSVKKQKTRKNSNKEEEEKKDSPTFPGQGKTYRNIEEGKKFSVTSYPDIKKVSIQSDLDFVIIACDGIWDCFSNEEAI